MTPSSTAWWSSDARLDREIAAVRSALTTAEADEMSARRLIEQLAVCWSAALLTRHGDAAVADAYLRSRIDRDRGAEYGTLSTHADIAAIAERAVPVPDEA